MNGSSGRFVLGILLGLLCGGGLYHLIAGRDAQTTENDALDRHGALNAANAAGRNSAADQLPDSDGSNGRQVASNARVATAELDPAQVRRVMADLDLASTNQAAGTGAIFGRVVDETGAGLAGVTLRLSAEDRSVRPTANTQVGQAPPPIDSLEDAIREAARQIQESRANHYESVTDATGRYRVERLLDRDWRVEAYLAGYRVDPDSSAYDVQINSELNFTAARVAEFAVSVYEPNGEQAKSAILQCTRPDQGTKVTIYTWTSDAAFARLPVGEYEITAFSSETTATSKALRSSEAKQVVVREEGMEPVRFDLRNRLGIRGVVRQSGGQLKSDYVYVSLMALGQQQAVDLAALNTTRNSHRTRSGAMFVFPDLNPGRYLIGASHAHRSEILTHQHQVVEVVDGWARCDMEVPTLDQARHLRVTVIGPDGKSVSDVKFNIQVLQGDSWSWGSQMSSTRDKTGAYLLAFDEEHGKSYFEDTNPEDKFKLTVKHDELGSRDVNLVRGQQELRVEFDLPGSLTVTIAGYAGSELEGRLNLNVVPKAKAGQPGNFMSMSGSGFSPAGVEEVLGLKPGPHIVELKVLRGASGVGSFGINLLERVEMNIRPGRNVLQLNPPPLYSLRVQCPDAEKGFNLRLNSVEHARGLPVVFMHENVDDNNFVTFVDLRPGEYDLTVYPSANSAGSQMHITIPSKDVVYDPKPMNAWRTQIFDETGNLFQVGLRHEDIVFGTDGAEFTKSPSLDMFGGVEGSKAAEVVLMVERNGKRIDITVPSGAIGDWKSMAGALLPVAR